MSGGYGTWDEQSGEVSTDEYSTYRVELLNCSALRGLDEHQISILERVLFNLEFLAGHAERQIRNSRWPADVLRAEQMPARIKSDRDIRAWKRFRANRECLDACAKTRAAIASGELVAAVFWALVAGNRSQEDLALMGRVRSESRIRQVKPRSDGNAARDVLVVREARALKASNPSWRASRIARELDGRKLESCVFPGKSRIRQILAKRTDWQRT